MSKLATQQSSLPAVIRPKPITLAEVERHLASNDAFAAMLARKPAQLTAIAHAIHQKDPKAYARFGNAASLRAHLVSLLAAH
jgi:hypothetical protein